MGDGFTLKDSDYVTNLTSIEGYVAIAIRTLKEEEYFKKEYDHEKFMASCFYAEEVDFEAMAQAMMPDEFNQVIPYFQNKKI